MGRADGDSRSWLKVGCVVVLCLIGLLAVAGGTTTFIALRQIRAEKPETRELTGEIPRMVETREPDDPRRLAGRIEIEIVVADLVVVPAPAGEAIRLEADYDATRYELQQEVEDLPGGGWVYRLRFSPIGSKMMALFRMKLGGPPPKLRLALPRDLPVTIDGDVDRSFAAMELGGMHLEAVELRVAGGAASVSFLEPLVEPMERLALLGNKGSIEVTSVGNASPESVVLVQHLGELDVDLRGAWRQDSDIRIKSVIAGGAIWLPGNADVEGLERRLSSPPIPREMPVPTLNLTIDGDKRTLIFVE